MRREAQNVLLLLLGGALLKISLNGSYLRYVKPSHQPWLIAAGAVLVVLAVVSIVRDLPGAAVGGSARGALAHAHDHPSRGPWLLLLPVLAMFLVVPPALGADSVLRAGGRASPPARAADDAGFPPLAAEDVVPMRLSDFAARSVWDETNALAGRTVRLTGFVVHDRAATYLARMAIACCAADAFPVKVELAGDGARGLADDTWVEIDARLRPGSGTRDNGYVPAVTVAGMRPIPAPRDPYEH